MADTTPCDLFVLESSEADRITVKTPLSEAGHTVHTFHNSETCLKALDSHESGCDVLIMGLKLFPFGGLELIRMIRKTRPSLPIIVLTSYGKVTTAVQSLKLGVYDFVEKPIDKESLLTSVRKAVAEFGNNHLALHSVLTKTEYEVLIHIIDGKSTKAIAAIRHRSIRTIEDHRYAIMHKLQVDNIVDLIKRTAIVITPEHE